MGTVPAQNPIPILIWAFIIGGWMAGLLWWERRHALRRLVDSKLRRDIRNLAVAALASAAVQFLGMPVGFGLAKRAQQQHSGLLQSIPFPGFLKSIGCDYFATTSKSRSIKRLWEQAGWLASSKRRPIKILPGFDSAAAREFLLGKVRKREPRQSFPSYEKRFQRALVLDGGALQRPHCWVKLEVAGLVLNFEGALAVGPLTLGGIRVAGAPLVAALPPPLPHRSLAEVAELNALLWERFQALRSGAEERR